MSPRLAALAVPAAGLAAGLGLAAASEAPAGADASARLPAGWHRAPTRLVPRLAMPRERVSVATFPIAVGGGGNCGREPVAAIRRMRPGDALISIQEYAVGARLRRHLRSAFPPRSGIRLDAQRGGPILRATIPFRDRGRAFDALVYTAGRPSPGLRDQIDALLAGLPIPR